LLPEASESFKKGKIMQITALVYVSMSELAKVMPGIDYKWIDDNPTKFKLMLYNLGLNTEEPYERQENIQHRKRFNEVVVSDRWVGLERIDTEWLDTSYSSTAAKDKKRGNKLLVELYAMRGMAE